MYLYKIKKIEDYGKQISQGKTFFERFSQEEHKGSNRGCKILSKKLTLLERNERTSGLVGKPIQEAKLIEQYAKQKGV
ncbi:MAG TPA: hypothetical protein ENI82_00940 [Bacteroidetes bacterium]|nr:hypothetical protein [Bacteroidota bacterium]